MKKQTNLQESAEIDNCLKEIEKLKELLEEWMQFEIDENPNDFTVMSARMSGLANKTKKQLESVTSIEMDVRV